VKGSGGIYTIEVDDQVVAKKSLDKGFPTEEETVEAVRRAMSASA
jgi:predicted Rdx family selenoprotein